MEDEQSAQILRVIRYGGWGFLAKPTFKDSSKIEQCRNKHRSSKVEA